jgi:hypothetical protein
LKAKEAGKEGSRQPMAALQRHCHLNDSIMLLKISHAVVAFH